jgi:DNA modification methylase
MLPAGAYVTLEHEYILIMRKGAKRGFDSADDKRTRHESAFFWEERNTWFSDVWEVKGTRQSLSDPELRDRSAAFPFEVPYRLICMYSVRGDTVLDPLVGTGTTTFAAMAAGRNSIGIDIDPTFIRAVARDGLKLKDQLNQYTFNRIRNHGDFVAKCRQDGKELRYTNLPHGVPVMTSQEVDLQLHFVDDIVAVGHDRFDVSYRLTGPEGGAEKGDSGAQLTLAI